MRCTHPDLPHEISGNRMRDNIADTLSHGVNNETQLSIGRAQGTKHRKLFYFNAVI